MSKNWANNLEEVKKAGSIKDYILNEYNKQRVNEALADPNFVVLERTDVIDDFMEEFGREIGQYATRNDVIEAYPEMEPSDEDYESGLKITQFNFGVYEIMKEINERYGQLAEIHPGKKFSEFVQISARDVWQNISKKDIEKCKNLRELVQSNYPAKMIIGVALEKDNLYFSNQNTDWVIGKHAREVINICPTAGTFNERVATAILHTVRALYKENRQELEKTPSLTLAQINKQAGIEKD